ncbi:MAG: hypothetical protein M0R80_16160 [Proteobacteria bacterium]|jgi:hypothetical protein|nr:hypothetical protein [Pseudomonadota bacterium]
MKLSATAIALLATSICVSAPTPANAETVAPAADTAPQPESVSMQRERKRIEDVMAIEGTEFDLRKYDAYRGRQGGGLALVVVGGVALVVTVVYGFIVVVGDMAEYDAEASEPDQDDDGRLGDSRQRVALWSLLAAGVATVAIGIPLAVSGKRGVNRQNTLRYKDVILAPPEPLTASLSLFFDPERGGSGLRLSVRF